MDAQDNSTVKSSDPVIEALALFDGYIPYNTQLTIEETAGGFLNKYVYRLIYTSQKSGRTLCVTAKGNALPTCHDELFNFYLHQLVLSPQDLRLQFNRLYFLEKRARQEQFLFGGSNTRVADRTSEKDKLGFGTYKSYLPEEAI